MALAILSAKVFTGDPARPRAEAVGIENGKIVAVGSNDEVLVDPAGQGGGAQTAGPVGDPGAGGRPLPFPELWALSATGGLAGPSLPGGMPGEDPGDGAAQSGPESGSWDGDGTITIGTSSGSPVGRIWTIIAPANPVMMVRACGHSQWVNSQALTAAKITRDTPDPAGGQIDRDPVSGEPTGMLRELRYLIERVIPVPSLEARKQAVLLAQKDALRLGVTGVHTCERLQQWEAFDALDRAGDLKVRVYHLLPPEDLDDAAARGVRPAHGSERLWAGHMKLYADGSLGAGTALLHEPYTDEPGNSGLVVMDLPLLQEKIELAYRRGFHVAIHAIGDKAVTHCLLAISGARASHPGLKRDRIEHVQIYRPEDLALFRELGVVGSVQPRFVSTDWCVAEKRWGAARCQTGYAWRSLMNAGIPLLFGSDAPVEPLAPISGLQAAVTRQTPEGTTAGRVVSRAEAHFRGKPLGLHRGARVGLRPAGAVGQHSCGQMGGSHGFRAGLVRRAAERVAVRAGGDDHRERRGIVPAWLGMCSTSF